MMNKTSFPDWLYQDCNCELHMCPICDSDFYVDMARDDEGCFLPDDDLEPPF